MYVERFVIDPGYLNAHFPIGLSVLGIVIIVFGVFVLRRMHQLGHFRGKNLTLRDERYFLSRIMITPLGAAAIVAAFVLYYTNGATADRLRDKLLTSEIDVAEGVVEVHHIQNAGGHDYHGDLIDISGHSFEIDYFVSTPYYHQSIAHGGVLDEGRYVRVFYIPEKKGKEPPEGEWRIVRILERIRKP